jgi:hypothetical protein
VHSDEAPRCEARALGDLRLLHGHDALKRRGGKACRQSSDRFEAGRINAFGGCFGSTAGLRELTLVAVDLSVEPACHAPPPEYSERLKAFLEKRNELLQKGRE